MPLKANAQFTYTGSLAFPDGSVVVYLTCPSPGPNMPGDYSCPLTSTQVAAILAAGNGAQQLAALNAIVGPYLATNFRPTSAIAGALAALPGQTLTVV